MKIHFFLKRIIATFCFWLAFSVQITPLRAESLVPEKTQQAGYIHPFKLFDNVFYVGDKWVSAYLIITSEGLIVIDTLEFPWSKWLPENIRALGFEPDNIKLIIVTHGHSDHVGGAGWLQSRYGSAIMMSKAAAEKAQTWFNKQDSDNNPPPKNISLVEDGDVITLGDTKLTVISTPGHTAGSISVAFEAIESEHRYNALVFGGVGTNFDSIELAHSYLNSVEKLQALHSLNPFEVNLANHPHRAGLFEKLNRSSKTNPFVDSIAISEFLNQLKAAGELKLQQLTIKQSEQSQ